MRCVATKRTIIDYASECGVCPYSLARTHIPCLKRGGICLHFSDSRLGVFCFSTWWKFFSHGFVHKHVGTWVGNCCATSNGDIPYIRSGVWGTGLKTDRMVHRKLQSAILKSDSHTCPLFTEASTNQFIKALLHLISPSLYMELPIN